MIGAQIQAVSKIVFPLYAAQKKFQSPTNPTYLLRQMHNTPAFIIVQLQSLCNLSIPL
jgi:hypothetical protein